MESTENVDVLTNTVLYGLNYNLVKLFKTFKIKLLLALTVLHFKS